MARMMTSEEAASRLGVKVTTLYVYVSRGLLESHPDPGSRRSLFAVEDVERLAARSRGGRRVESRLAVVTTSITLLDERGPVYRGRPATELATTEPFERVAELLWRHDDRDPGPSDPRPSDTRPSDTGRSDTGLSDAGPSHAGPSDAGPSDAGADWSPCELEVPDGLRWRDRLPWTTVMSGAHDAFRADLRPVAVARAARTLVASLVASLGAPGRAVATPVLVLDDGTRIDGSLAGRLTAALAPDAAPEQLAEVTGAVNAAMVLLADHELATSTLAVRVAASTRADVYDAVLSGLGTSAGTLHSAASDLALELLGAAGSDGAEVAMGDALRRWGTVPGFGHGAYPEGDPRAIQLLGIVAALGDERHRELVQQLVDTAAGRGLPPANIDFALAALGSAIGAPAGAMPTLFSIARVAGWVAHYLEELGERPLRFRARAIHATETS